MIDYCSSKRIFSFVLALLGFSIIVFFVEELAEESQTGDMKMKKMYIDNETHRKHSSNDCWLKEPFTVLQSCLPCSEFELRALKASHCAPTGYYDRLNCTDSGIQALRPCSSRLSHSSQSSFYFFTLFNAILLIFSYFIATKRKEFLDRHAYMRVAQQFDD